MNVQATYRERMRVPAVLLILAVCALALACLAPTQAWAATKNTTTSIRVDASLTGSNLAVDVYDGYTREWLNGRFTAMGRPDANYAVEAGGSGIMTAGMNGKVLLYGTGGVDYYTKTLNLKNVNWLVVDFVFVQSWRGAETYTRLCSYDKWWGNRKVLYEGPRQEIENRTNQTFYADLMFTENSEELKPPTVEMKLNSEKGSSYASGSWTNQDVVVRAKSSNNPLPYEYDIYLQENKPWGRDLVSKTHIDWMGSGATSWCTVGETPVEGRSFGSKVDTTTSSNGDGNDYALSEGEYKVLVDKTKPTVKVSLDGNRRLVDESTDALSGVRSTEVAIVADGTAGGAPSYVLIGSASALDASKGYTVHVRVTDVAGNVAETVQHFDPDPGTDPDPDPGTDPDPDPGSGSGDGYAALKYSS